jgi:RNA polymerase sigma-70 factor (ECF subfamily)
VLILREVLRFDAASVADLLGTSVASVNSALQRARATLASRPVSAEAAPSALDPAHRDLLARYLDAFERYDMDAFVDLLHEDATQSMPPFPMWLRGADELRAWMVGPGAECRGSRLVPVQVNGTPGFAQYRRQADGPGHAAWSLHVLDVRDGRVAGITYFLDTRLFTQFGLPLTLPAD